jgi:hypothetical protein
MFLVARRMAGTTTLVFIVEDPRQDGLAGGVIEDVELGIVRVVDDRWGHGRPLTGAIFGQDPDDPKHYELFRDDDDPQMAGFLPVACTSFEVHRNWSKYLQAIEARGGYA